MRPALLAVVLVLSASGCMGRASAAIRDEESAAPTASPSPASHTVLVSESAPTSAPPAAANLLALPTQLTGAPEDFPRRRQPQVVTVPILLYHHILADTRPVRYTIAAQRFEQQLDYLLAHGYQTITMQDLVNASQIGAPLPDRPAMLTFDDGNQDLMEMAYPRMQARGMVGVVYVVGNRIGVEGFLNAESLQRSSARPGGRSAHTA